MQLVTSPRRIARRRTRRLAATGFAALALSAGAGAAVNASTPPGTEPVGTGTDAAGSSDDATKLAVGAAAQLAVQPYRFEADFSLSGDGVPPISGTNVLTGELLPEQGVARIHVDATSIVEPLISGQQDLPPQLADLDWTMEFVVTGETLYLRGGLFELVGQLSPETAELGQLTDTWGSIDLATLAGGEIPEAAAFDPAALLTVVDSSEVVGTRNVDGEELTGLRVDISLDALGQLAETAAASTGSPMETLPPELEGQTLPVELWVTADGAPREIVVDVDSSTFAEVDPTGATGSMDDFQLQVVVRIVDLGDSSITVDEPTGAIDITDQFLDLADLPTQSS